MKENKKKVLWITRTAIFIALTIVIQFSTAQLLGTLVTGSLVNLLLILAVMTSGVASGLIVAVVSPVLATLVGIGPLWVLVPFIALGNCVLILIWYLLAKRALGEKLIGNIAALVAGAAMKFFVLYLTIVQMAIPLFLTNLPAKKVQAITVSFSLPQLFTALIGGALAVAILPIIKKAVKSAKD